MSHFGNAPVIVPAFLSGVAGTAVGPYLFSVAHDQLGSYRPATLLCVIVAIVWLAACPHADRAQ